MIIIYLFAYIRIIECRLSAALIPAPMRMAWDEGEKIDQKF